MVIIGRLLSVNVRRNSFVLIVFDKLYILL